jgi:hypothetical protein
MDLAMRNITFDHVIAGAAIIHETSRYRFTNAWILPT